MKKTSLILPPPHEEKSNKSNLISLGMMQPYFMPYIGYFQMIKAADKYVIYNDVNYIKQGWVNRNSILVQGKRFNFHIQLKEASQNKKFNEIEVSDDFTKFRRTLECNYSRAPFFHQTMDLLEQAYAFPEKRLDLFIKNSLELIFKYLAIKKEFMLASDIEKDESLKGVDRLLNICHTLGVDIYSNSIGGVEMYDKSFFAEHGITLRFLKTDEDLSYKQFSDNEFTPNLSFVDVLMFNSPDEINKLLDRYTWV